MHTLIYDGTFEGYLSAIFYSYKERLKEVRIARSAAILFDTIVYIESDSVKADRVWAALSQKLPAESLQSIYCSYLADSLAEEDNLLLYIRYALGSDRPIGRDFSNFLVLRMERVERMVHRESHRMKAFIRFKLMSDNIYYAAIEPDFNVIPLIRTHFENRYSDQEWLIYDLRRHYGIYYNKHTTEIVKLSFSDHAKTDISLCIDDKEELYQTLWQQYYKSTNIPTRKNMKLHIQHTPRRYWRYLSEKHIIGKEII